jgi:hypothetical protein
MFLYKGKYFDHFYIPDVPNTTALILGINTVKLNKRITRGLNNHHICD